MFTRIHWFLIAVTAAMLAACVTIHVYFPEAAAERAADRFIQDVLGDAEAQRPAPPPPGNGGMAAAFGSLFISAAHAQDPNIHIDTPQIQSIKARMAARQREHLAGWFDAGAIGFARDGTVAIRDRGAVSLAERRDLERIVNDENADRNVVYHEIAVANGRPEWEGEIRETFARQWIANARSGWFYQDAQGNWVQK